jgi:SAM-dependent methyltransferase
MAGAPFPDGFFERADETADARFYAPDRFVTHIDAAAIAAVGELYRELGVSGRVLDLMSSWISHFLDPPDHLTVLGMNERELAANAPAAARVRHDLNEDPTLPFDDDSFDDVLCAVSVDYMTRPVEVFTEVGRVLRPGGRFVVTFSNRCFPTKAIRGWLATDGEGHRQIVAAYFIQAGGFGPVAVEERIPAGRGTDPLTVMWAATLE